MQIKTMSKGLAREFASGQVRELTEVELDCVGGGAPRHFYRSFSEAAKLKNKCGGH